MESELDSFERSLSHPQLSSDVVLAILDYVLPSSAAGSEGWDSDHLKMLLIDRTIYSIVITRLYHTVVLRTTKSLERFLNTLSSSPRLGPIVYNLWISHEDTIPPRMLARYAITTNALATVALTPNLQRLAIGSPLYYNNTHLSNRLPFANVVDLSVPSSWITRASGTPGADMLSLFPANLQTLRVRGPVGKEEGYRIVASCPAIRHVYVRMYWGMRIAELELFALVLLEKLKEVVWLELSAPESLGGKELARLNMLREKYVELGDKVSIRLEDDEEYPDVQLWLDRNTQPRPSWSCRMWSYEGHKPFPCID